MENVLVWACGAITGLSFGAMLSANDEGRYAPPAWYTSFTLGIVGLFISFIN